MKTGKRTTAPRLLFLADVLNMESHGMTAVRDPVSVEALSFNQLVAVGQWPLLLESYRFQQPLLRNQGLMMFVE